MSFYQYRKSHCGDKPVQVNFILNPGPACDNTPLSVRYFSCIWNQFTHDDVIKWKHFCATCHLCGEFTDSPHKSHWRGALMFSFICVCINGWVNNREAGDLRRYRVYYDVTVIVCLKYECHEQLCHGIFTYFPEFSPGWSSRSDTWKNCPWNFSCTSVPVWAKRSLLCRMKINLWGEINIVSAVPVELLWKGPTS